jgi:competence protein ComEC
MAFFWGTLLFLLGVLLKSFFSGTFVLFAFAGIFILTLLVLLMSDTHRVTDIGMHLFLTLLLFFGSFYYSFCDTLTHPTNIPFGFRGGIRGEVIEAHQKPTYQTAVIKISEPFSGKLYAMLPVTPEISFGDTLVLEGSIEKPETNSFARFLLKDNIFAVTNFPRIRSVLDGPPSLSRALASLSERFQVSYSRALSPSDSALLMGITFGNTDEFSKEFKESMRKSGTTHIVALSGYNVTIVAMGLLFLFRFFLRRQAALFSALACLFLFVLMTGASASVVRAAGMAVLFIFLTLQGRLRDPKNIIVFTALLMTLWNPRVLAYDIGFQLSFLAVMGILYITPFLRKLFKIKEENQNLLLEALFTTLSAQIAAAPFLVLYFENIFGSSLLANMIIAFFVPPAMAFGFLLAFLGIFSIPLATFFGLFATPFLRIISGIIEFFSYFAFLPIHSTVGIFLLLGYYGGIGGLLYFVRQKEKGISLWKPNIF